MYTRHIAHSWSARRRLIIGVILATLLLSSVSVVALVARHAVAATPNRDTASRVVGPRDAGQYFLQRHQSPSASARAKAAQKAKKAPQLPMSKTAVHASASPSNTPAASDTWIPLGPAPDQYGLDDYAGRVTALALNPTNANEIWLGSSNGGLWHSTDGGQHYAPLSDAWTSMAIGSVAVDPQNPDVIYAGTGEANYSGDGMLGTGIYKSIDHGVTWTLLGQAHFNGWAIASLSVDPNNESTVLAAVATRGKSDGTQVNGRYGGIWRSTDGGQHWTQIFPTQPEDTNLVFYDYGTDVLFDPAHPGVAYAGLANSFALSTNAYEQTYNSAAGVYKSVDSGASWTQLRSGIPYGQDVERVSLGLSSDGNTLFSLLTDGDVRDYSKGEPAFGKLINSKIYVSANVSTASPAFTGYTTPSGMANDEGYDQYWYNSVIGVDPTNAQVAYAGGLDLWKTTDGGAHWVNATDYVNGDLYPEMHALTFLGTTSPNFYVGSDGGIWRDAHGASITPTTFDDLNQGGLNITEVYGGGYGELGTSSKLDSGTDSLGVVQYPLSGDYSGPGRWIATLGGTSVRTIVDYTNNQIIYAEVAYGLLYKSTNGGASWTKITKGINTADEVSFNAPVVMSATNHNVLWMATDRIYKTTNGGTSWSAVSPDFAYGALVTLAVSPVNDNVIYTDWHNSNDGGAHWITQFGGYSDYPGGPIVDTALDPSNPNILYQAFTATYEAPYQELYRSTDFGAHWQDIGLSLPGAPILSIWISPRNPNLVVVATDVGVFATTAADQPVVEWYRVGTGLPNVPINQLFSDHDGTKLFAATHGRGVWVLSTAALLVSPSTPITATVGVGSNGGTYSKTFNVTNAGFAPMSWSLDTTGLPACLTVAGPTSGTLNPGESSSTLTASVSTATAGTCVYNLNFTADGLFTSEVVPVSVEVVDLSKTWYFAEGYTASGFDTWLTLANPGTVDATATVIYLIQGTSTPKVVHYTVAADTRKTVHINAEVGAGKSVAMAISSTQPIVAERPMYVDSKLGSTPVYGGHSVMGATAPGQEFDFGYVDTTATHTTWFTILNQNTSALTATMTYYPAGGGTPIVKTHTVAAKSRGSFEANNDKLAAGTYSVRVHLSLPGLVERPMYLKDAATGRVGVTDLIGVAAPQTAWYFADGQTDSNHTETYILSNQDATNAAHVHLTLYGSDGSAPTFDYTVPAGQQVKVPVNALAGVAALHGASVTSDDQPILVDRYVSLKYVGPTGANRAKTTVNGVTDGPGTAQTGQAFYFAEGFAGGKTNEYLELVNPDASHAATVTVSYLPSTGGAPTVVTYTVPAHSRVTVDAGAVMVGTSFSMQVLADRPVVAERTLFFIFGVGTINRPSADVTVGYQP